MGRLTYLLADAREAGLTVERETGADGVTRLVVTGPETAEPLARELLAHKAEVLAGLAAGDPAVAWRVNAMRPQVPRTGAVGFLSARPEALSRDTPGACPSCGEPNEPGQSYCCRACVAAKWIVLGEAREGVADTV